VVARQEWPVNTDLAAYVASIRAVILDTRSGVVTSLDHGRRQLTILGHSGQWQGPAGFPHMLVDYRVSTGHWVTAFQPRLGSGAVIDPARQGVQWLRLVT